MSRRPHSGDGVPGGPVGGPAPPTAACGYELAWETGEEPEAPARRSLEAWRIRPGQMRLLALLSALVSGLVIWAGLSGQGSSGLAAAVALHNRLLAGAPAAAPAAPQPEASAAGGSSSEDGAAEPAPSHAQPEGGQSQPAPSPAAAPPTQAETQGQSAPASTPGPPKGSPAPSTSTAGAAPAESKIKHMFVITLSSPGYDQTWGPASSARYLTNQLRPRGTLLSSYYAIGHLDLPNYIAMISGQPPNAQTSADCPTYAQFPAGSKVDAGGRLEAPGCEYPLSVLTVGDQLTSFRHQWRAYVQDLANGPKPVQTCRHPISDQADETQHARPGDAYAARHNPFVYFHSLLDLGDCASNDLPLTQLSSDLATAAKTPNYSFIVPNLCNGGSEAPCLDGSPGGLQAADAFLAEWVPKILASPAYIHDGLLVITFSDGPPSDISGCCSTSGSATPVGGGRVGALLLSRFVKPGGESTAPYNHYSLLRTVEDIFGLSHLANAGEAGVASFSNDALPGVFQKHR